MEKPFIHCCIGQTVPHEQGASAETWGFGYLRKDGWKESACFKYSASCNGIELLPSGWMLLWLPLLTAALVLKQGCGYSSKGRVPIRFCLSETVDWILLCVCSDCFHCRDWKRYWKPKGWSSYLQQRLYEGKDGQAGALKLHRAFQDLSAPELGDKQHDPGIDG